MVAHDYERLSAGRVRDKSIPMSSFDEHSPTYIGIHVPVAGLRVLLELSLLQEHQGA